MAYTIKDLTAVSFRLTDKVDSHYWSSPAFVRLDSPFHEGIKWAVRVPSACLNKDGEFEYEPMPSARDSEFYARCRFDTLEEAVAAYNHYLTIKPVFNTILPV